MDVVAQLPNSPLLIATLAAAFPVMAVSGVALLTAKHPGEARFGLDPFVAESAAQPSLITRLLDRASRPLAPLAMRLLGERQVAKTRWQLEAAGRPGGYTVESFMGRRAVFTVIGLVWAVLFVADGNLLSAFCAVLGGALIMDVWLSRRLRTRQAAIERALPDFLDILAVTISAGLSFRQALARLAEAVKGPLSEEVLITLRQMEIGVARRQALENLRARNESPTLSAFVTALLQGEELGAPLSDTLTELAADLRRTWDQEARRRAAKAEPKCSLVLAMIIAPASILLLAGGLVLDMWFGNDGIRAILGT